MSNNESEINQFEAFPVFNVTYNLRTSNNMVAQVYLYS